MSDLVERLREDARGGMAYHELSDEAADEIERLRAALKLIAEEEMRHEGDVVDIARKALQHEHTE